MSFWCSKFSQKMNENNSTLDTLVIKSIFFVRFLGELKVPKRHFEINWSLADNPMSPNQIAPSNFAVFNAKFITQSEHCSKLLSTVAYPHRIGIAQILSLLVHSKKYTRKFSTGALGRTKKVHSIIQARLEVPIL